MIKVAVIILSLYGSLLSGGGNTCNEYVGEYYLSSYYHPVVGQSSYFGGSYESDFYVNCSGSCDITASGYKLKSGRDENKILACPPNFLFGDKLMIKFEPTHPEYPKKLHATCEDRGGAIKNKRLDLWIGKGEKGKEKPWIRYSTKHAHVYKCKKQKHVNSFLLTSTTVKGSMWLF